MKKAKRKKSRYHKTPTKEVAVFYLQREKIKNKIKSG